MHDEEGTLATTTSLCPTCLDRVPGRYVARDGSVHLARRCPEHGETSRKVWDSLDHWRWARDHGPTAPGDPGQDPLPTAEPEPNAEERADAPLEPEPDVDPSACGPGCGCGATADASGDGTADGTGTAGPADRAPPGDDLVVDNDHACLAVVEVTQDCNLSCSYCFASSGPGGAGRSFAEVEGLLETIIESGGPRPVQFSGGEPTVRDDLPELVERAREMGFEHVQVNTNGLALARREGYAERLADAGVTAVYLQFDGLEPSTYEAIREVDLTDEKHAAIAACRRADLPVVLVPTVVPGVNDGAEMAGIVRFGLDNLDVVESINFQPVAHFGRVAERHDRFSLDEAARRLAEGFDGLAARDFLPIPCCSSYCQSATALRPDGEGGAVPLTRFFDEELIDSLAGEIDESDWMEMLANTPAGTESACSAGACCDVDVPAGAASFLEGTLPVSFTGFMDADAADVERLDDCCISVPTPDGELVPFCAYNMTTDDGAYALRTRHGWGGRPRVDAPVPGEDGSVASDDD
ncbi:MAG: radical SAM protein [Haloarculaceae archaeon]